MQTATHPRRMFGTTHRRSMLGTIALAQIAGINTIKPNFGAQPSQPLGTAAKTPVLPMAAAYHENGGGSGGIDKNGGGSSCIGAGSGDVKNSLGKNGHAHVTRDANDTDEDGVAVDPNLLAAHCISSGRTAMQTQRC